MKKSAKARLQMRKRGTSILVLLTMLTSSTVPLPSNANRKTIQTPQRSDHQPMRSSHGMNGPVGENGRVRWRLGYLDLYHSGGFHNLCFLMWFPCVRFISHLSII